MAGIVCQHVQNMSSTNPRRIFSPNLWRHCPLDIIRAGGVDYKGFEDDFLTRTAAFASATAQGDYITYQDTGVTITQPAGIENGVLQFAGNDLDNDEGSIQYGPTTGAPFVLPAAGGGNPLWFEARFKKAAVTANSVAVFVGLASQASAVANILLDDVGNFDNGTTTDLDGFGFSVLNTTGANIDVTHTITGTATTTTPLSAGKAMTADTYANVGFYYNPDAMKSKRITFYIDNVEQSSYVTAAGMAATTLFPGGEEMSPLFATKVGASAESIVTLDWWACYQLG